MDLEGDGNTDEYIVTALQIFNYCGADSSSTLRVDALMDKFAPFVKTNKAEYSYLRALLDPEQSNPEITVSELAATLDKYSESQKVKVDLEESFNLKSGQVPHDSDSGISTDGFQLLEELQCELREKSHLAQQLRAQLDYSDRHHEEALAAVTAERDTLRAHLNMLREESTSLTHVRRDYEDVCERLCVTERSLEESRKELDGTKKRAKILTEQVSVLETEKLTLQELLSKSKEECHRINSMYASRQSTLLEENETLRAEHADLSARAQDQEEFVQMIIKEKVLVEMELKEVLNKTNQTQLRMDRSIDVSYTEDQMLTALDSLNADSRFVQESHLLDEEAFVNALKEDQGRATNVSLFDEIRLSFCNMSRSKFHELNYSQTLDKTTEESALKTVGMQTDCEIKDLCQKCHREKLDMSFINIATQTNELNVYDDKDKFANRNNDLYYFKNNQYSKVETKNQSTNTNFFVFEVFKDTEVMNFGTQTDLEPYHNNNNVQNCIDCTKCSECERLKKHIIKLESELRRSNIVISDMTVKLNHYETNLDSLKRFLDEGNERNNVSTSATDSLKSRLDSLGDVCNDHKERIEEMCCERCSAEIQTECEQSSVSTQAEIPCGVCVKRNTSQRSLRRYLWEPLKCLFQLFAVLCFVCAIFVLCGITRRWHTCREPVPWRWLQPHDLLDLFLTIDYVDHVPM